MTKLSIHALILYYTYLKLDFTVLSSHLLLLLLLLCAPPLQIF